MKRVKRSLLALVLSFCMALSILPAPAFADEAIIAGTEYFGEGLQWTLYTGGRLVIEKNPEYDGTEFNMPDYINMRSTPPWYSYRDSIESVEIKSPVTSIGNFSFYNYRLLTSVIIGNTVVEIGENAFSNCQRLTDVTIQGNVKTIGESAFNSSAIKSLNILGSVGTIGREAFRSCNFEDLTISAETICDYAFSYCSMKTATINAETICDYAFSYCFDLKTVTITEGTKKIGECAFANCSDLETATIKDGVEEIGLCAFGRCTSLSKITVPASVVEIGEEVFERCKALKEIDFAGNDKYVVENSVLFALKDSQKNVLIAAAPKSLPAEYTVPDTVKRIGRSGFSECQSLKSLILPSGLEEIGHFAFYNCSQLNALVIPESVATIESYFWDNCTLSTFGNCKFDITIPGSVKCIPNGLFHMASTQHITLGEGCTEIKSAFSSCQNLQSISLPSTLKTINTNAISRCPNLSKIYYEGTAADWRKNVRILIPNSELFDANIIFNFKDERAHRLTYAPGKAGTAYQVPTLFDALDKEVTLSASNFSAPTGGKFKGWLIGGKLYQPGEPCSVEGVTEDITATAIWFDKDIPDTVPSKITLDYQYDERKEEIPLPENSLPTPTRDGYRFDGWYTETSGGEEITGETVSKLTDGTTLYAHWTKIFTVTFDAAGGTVSPKTKTVTKGMSYGSLPVPVREGYDFDGWYTEMEDGEQVTETTTVELDGDQTLYAHWTEKDPEITYKITFNANGGEVKVTDKIVTKGKTYGTLPVPVREGLLFDGWYTAEVDGKL
ncbi:MAG: leucine-rich repeat protein, partial [Oscillospiraceae bacterium]|nr:leucine-rich repeat protein [Oscillospiraceae bacterium]